MIRILDCIPTPLEDCPESIKSALKDIPGNPIGLDPKYQKFAGELSFMLRRLWTYSLIKEKALMFVYSTDKDTKFIGIKIENEEEFIGEITVPFALSYDEVEQGIDIVADKMDAVYCLNLTKHMYP